MVAGTASMIEQNWQKSSQPSIDSARSATTRASARLAAARIIVPNTRCSRCLATIEFRASGNARSSSRLASAASPWASRTSASRCSECASPAPDPRSRCSALASVSSAAARSRSPDSSAASPVSARANAAARRAPLRSAVPRRSRASSMTSAYGVGPYSRYSAEHR